MHVSQSHTDRYCTDFMPQHFLPQSTLHPLLMGSNLFLLLEWWSTRWFLFFVKFVSGFSLIVFSAAVLQILKKYSVKLKGFS